VSQIGRCALLVLLVFHGGIATAKPPEKLNLTSAVNLAREWLLNARPQITREAKLGLQDVTTPEIWSVMGAQLFAKTPESFILLPDFFLIKGTQVYPIGRMKFWCFSHLNQNSGDALVYSELSGPKSNQAIIHALLPSPDRLISLGAVFIFFGEISVSCNANGIVALDVVRLFVPGSELVDLPARLGTVTVVERGGKPYSLRVQIEASAPQAIRNAIWKLNTD
jgi:hypothetical protein